MATKRNEKKGPTRKTSEEKAERNSADLSWFFPSTGYGEEQGFADSQLEHFQGDHEKYIAREAIQNSVDARLDGSQPVSIVFERILIPSSSLPGHSELSNRLKRCLDFVKNQNQEKAKAFFSKALKILQDKQLSVLRISDYNTKGLMGDDEDREGHWYRLVKATGTSSPKGVTGGSFGIGKGAPIAASALHTVFYVSVNEEGRLACQGKARLISHYDDKKDVRQGVGFYGVDRCAAIREKSLIPKIFERTERGTDIYVIGYESDNGWKQKLVKSVLNNFWLSILHGNLEVIIRDGDELTITKNNLSECLDEYDAFDAKFFFEAVMNPTQTFEQDLKHLGKVSLCVRKGDGYPGEIMMVRKPKMLVREKPYRVLREPYAGVFICEDDKGNALLRDLEPPAHDKWDPARAPNGPAALRELDDFIKKSLKTMAESLTSEPEDIPGLDRYLPDSEDRDYPQSGSGEAFEETGLSTGEESGREIGAERDADTADNSTVTRKSIVTNKQEDKVLHIPPEGSDSGTRGRATGPKNGMEDGVRINTSSISFRSFVNNSKDGLEYRLVMTGREDCEGAIRLVAIGDDGSYTVDILSAKDIKTDNTYETGDSLIKGLVIKAGETLKLAVKLPSANKYALGIETYES